MILPWPSHVSHCVEFLAQILVATNKWPRFPGCADSPKLSQRVTWWRKKAGMMAFPAATKSSNRSEWCLWIVKWLDIGNMIWVRLWEAGPVLYQCSYNSDPGFGTLKVEIKCGNLSSYSLKNQGKNNNLARHLVLGNGALFFQLVAEIAGDWAPCQCTNTDMTLWLILSLWFSDQFLVNRYVQNGKN